MRTCRIRFLMAAVILAVAACAAVRAEDTAPAPAAPGPLRVVFFGDSITGHRPGESYQGRYLKFADLVGLMLEARRGVGRVEVINSGWAGDATYPKPSQGMPGALARLEEDVLAHRPDIAVVLIGGNDVLRTDADRQRTAENLQTIARRISEAGIRLLMLQYPPALPDPNAPGKAWTHIDDKNTLIAQAARAAGAPLLDLGPALTAAAEQYPRTDLVHAVDGIHLQPRGEMVYARAIFARLDALGWIDPPRQEK